MIEHPALSGDKGGGSLSSACVVSAQRFAQTCADAWWTHAEMEPLITACLTDGGSTPPALNSEDHFADDELGS